MSEQQVLEPADTLDLAKVDVLNAVQVFTGGGMNAILEGIEAKVRAMTLDVSTFEGRAQIRAVAYRVVRTKTALDAEGKRLTEEWRRNTAKVNEERKKSSERLDALAEEVRKPLTDFENKEKIRVAAHEAALADMSGMLAAIGQNESVSTLETYLLDISNAHPGRNWEEFSDRATKLRREAQVLLIGKIEARKKFEADQAELARLRAEETKRLQEQRDQELRWEAAEKARLEAERKAQEAAEAERQRVAAEAERVRVEHERVQLEAEEKRLREEKARLAAEQRAEEAEEAAIAAAKKAESDRVMAAQKAQAEKIALEKKAEAEKLAAEVRAADALRAAQEKAQRDADAAVALERQRVLEERKRAELDARLRERDKAHKAKIRGEIVEDLAVFMRGTSDVADAELIADAIMAGKVRRVKVIY